MRLEPWKQGFGKISHVIFQVISIFNIFSLMHASRINWLNFPSNVSSCDFGRARSQAWTLDVMPLTTVSALQFLLTCLWSNSWTNSLVPQWACSTTGHSEPSVLLLWISSPYSLCHFSFSSKSFLTSFLPQKKLCCVHHYLLKSLTVFSCYSLHPSWQHGSLCSSIRIRMLKCRFLDAPLTS